MMVVQKLKELAEEASPRCFFTSRKPALMASKRRLWRYRFGIHSRLELWQVLQNGVLRSMFFFAEQSLANVVVSLWQPLGQ